MAIVATMDGVWTERLTTPVRPPTRASSTPAASVQTRVQQGGRSGDDKQENPGTHHVLRGVWCVYVLVAAHAYTARRRPPPASLGVASHVSRTTERHGTIG